MKKFLFLFLPIAVSNCGYFLTDDVPSVSNNIQQSKEYGVYLNTCQVTIDTLSTAHQLPVFGEAWLEKRWLYSSETGPKSYDQDKHNQLIIQSPEVEIPAEIYCKDVGVGMNFNHGLYTFHTEKGVDISKLTFIITETTEENRYGDPRERKEIGILKIKSISKQR